MDKFFTSLGISLIIFASFLVYQRNNPSRIAFAKADVVIEDVDKVLLQPNFIKISSLDINLPVYSSEIKNNKWEVANDGVSYLKTSVSPGQIGNSIMYGHNWSNLLGRLVKIKTGDVVEINYTDNSKKEFIVTLIQEVNPNDVTILNETNDRRLTIYTCSGFMDSKRFVVVAILK